MKAAKLVDLFAGCGGMSLGFQNAGFEVIAAYDNWLPAVEVYRKNFQHDVFQRDLLEEEVTEELRRYNADIIIGGPPCQDFSIAGQRNHRGRRANLTILYSEIIAAIMPKWFVMENVYNIERFPVLEKALRNFKNAGYGITKGVFDASLMGVPQMRRRYFAIGRLGEKDEFLRDKLEAGLASDKMTVRDYLGNSLKTEYYYMHPRSYNRRAVFSVDEPSSTIRGVNRPIPDTYQPHPADKTTDLRLVRSLSTRERSLIQTFPKSFVLAGTKSNIEQMIGNAVPVKMAEYIAKRIMDAL